LIILAVVIVYRGVML